MEKWKKKFLQSHVTYSNLLSQAKYSFFIFINLKEKQIFFNNYMCSLVIKTNSNSIF